MRALPHLVSAACALWLLAGDPAAALAQTRQPTVNSARTDDGLAVLTIDGLDLASTTTGAPKPTVTMAGIPLLVLTASTTEIRAELPLAVAPGTYQVYVKVPPPPASPMLQLVNRFEVTIGSTGPAGPEGPIGPQGPAGASGAPGSQGPQGEAGPAGAAGVQGPTGPQGPQGPAGEAGAVGAQGLQGETGAQGPMPTIALGGGLTGDGSPGSPLRVASPLIAFSANASDPALIAAGYVQAGVFSSGVVAGWQPWDSVPNGTAHAGRAIIGNTLYLVGGYLASGAVTGRMLSIDLANPQATWVERAAMPTARAGAATVLANGKIHVIGGTAAAIGALRTGALAVHEVYDPGASQWTATAAPLPQIGEAPTPGRSFMASGFGADGMIHLIGGVLGNGTVSGTYLRYNISSNTWVSVFPNQIPPRYGQTGAMLVNGAPFFVITGGRDAGDLVRAETYYVNYNSSPGWFSTTSLPAVADFASSFVDQAGVWHVLGVAQHHTMSANATAWAAATPSIPFDSRGGAVVRTASGSLLLIQGGVSDATDSGAVLEYASLPTIYRYQLASITTVTPPSAPPLLTGTLFNETFSNGNTSFNVCSGGAGSDGGNPSPGYRFGGELSSLQSFNASQQLTVKADMLQQDPGSVMTLGLKQSSGCGAPLLAQVDVGQGQVRYVVNGNQIGGEGYPGPGFFTYAIAQDASGAVKFYRNGSLVAQSGAGTPNTLGATHVVSIRGAPNGSSLVDNVIVSRP